MMPERYPLTHPTKPDISLAQERMKIQEGGYRSILYLYDVFAHLTPVLALNSIHTEKTGARTRQHPENKCVPRFTTWPKPLDREDIHTI